MTAQHPVYSLDRGDFVAAGELSAGERLATLAGPTAVLGIKPQHKPQTVYNLEVQGQHVFRVTSNGLLVHNSYGNAPRSGVTPELISQLQQPGQRLSGQLVSLVRRRAGFADEGVPLIIDSNNSLRGMAEALRARGYNVRMVKEIFGPDPGDPAIISLAETLGGRVLTNNMRHFGRTVGIRIDPRARSVDTWIRLIEEGLQ